MMTSSQMSVEGRDRGLKRSVGWGAVVTVFLATVVISAGWTLLRPRANSHSLTVPSGKARLSVAERERLSVDPQELNVGTVWAEPQFRHAFHVMNPSTETVTVERMTADCDCTSVTPASFQLAPGTSQEITVTIDLTRSQGKGVEPTEKSLDSTITFVFSDQEIQNAKLRGTVAYPFAAPGTLVFKEAIPFGEASSPKRFTVWKDRRISKLDVSISEAEGDLIEVAGLETPTSVTFDLSPTTNRPLGRFVFDVQVAATADDGKRIGAMPIRVSGRIGSDIIWSPQELLLVTLDSQSPAHEDVVLWSESGQSFEILPDVEAPDFVNAVIAAPDESAGEAIRTIHVSCAANPAARMAGMILLSVRTSDSRKLRIPIPVDVQPVAIKNDDAPEITAVP